MSNYHGGRMIRGHWMRTSKKVKTAEAMVTLSDHPLPHARNLWLRI